MRPTDTSFTNGELCDVQGVRQLVERIASSQDNTVAESHWASLIRELAHRVRFEKRADARRAIIAWWINRYNAVQLHSSLGYVTPIEW